MHSTQVSTTVKSDVLVTRRLTARRVNSTDKAVFGVLHVDTCTTLMHNSANAALFIAQVCDSCTCSSTHTQVNTGEAKNVLGSRVVGDTQQGRGIIARSVQNITQRGVSNRTLFTHQLGEGQFFKPPCFTRSASIAMGAILTNHSVEGNLTTFRHSPDSILSVQLYTALNIRRPAGTEHTGHSVLTMHSNTVVHASYSAGRNHTCKCHIGLFFNEVTGRNVHGVISITTGSGLTYNSRCRNFQIMTFGADTRCSNCIAQCLIRDGANLTIAAGLFEGIGYNTQPGLIIGVRLIPLFKGGDQTFSINGSPLTFSRKVRSKTTNIAGLRAKLSTEICQGGRNRPNCRRAR